MRRGWLALLGAVLVGSLAAQSPWLEAYRVVCERWEVPEEAEAYLAFVQTADASELSPEEVTAFRAAAEMIHANHGWNPLEQWNVFVTWRDALEAAIESSPQAPNLRLVRYGIQSSAPKFLGYRNELDSDRKLCLKALRDGFWSHSIEFEAFVEKTFAATP